MATVIAKQPEGCLTEAEAIRQAKNGDAAAFEYLYKANCRRVYSVCLRMIKNPAEAEDLTQQAFLQLFRKIGTFRSESRFSTWLHRVTVNIVLMHLCRKKPTEILEEDLERSSSDGEGSREYGSGAPPRSWSPPDPERFLIRQRSKSQFSSMQNKEQRR